MKINIFDERNLPAVALRERILDFLFVNLQEYGDPRADIDKAMAYALGENDSPGGFILAAEEEGAILGAVVVNATGMRDYIPENILVYIASHASRRGEGIGGKLMRKAIERADGDIALHVEPDNPARRLYEKTGFTTKYIEMRFKSKGSA